MKKVLFLMAILGGLTLAAPVMAQRANPGPNTYNKHERFGDSKTFNGERREGQHGYAEGRRNRQDGAQWRDHRGPGKNPHKFHGKKHGHCRKGVHGRGQRRD